MPECPMCESAEEPVPTKDFVEAANFQRVFRTKISIEQAVEKFPLMCGECYWIGTEKEFDM